MERRRLNANVTGSQTKMLLVYEGSVIDLFSQRDTTEIRYAGFLNMVLAMYFLQDKFCLSAISLKLSRHRRDFPHSLPITHSHALCMCKRLDLSLI